MRLLHVFYRKNCPFCHSLKLDLEAEGQLAACRDCGGIYIDATLARKFQIRLVLKFIFVYAWWSAVYLSVSLILMTVIILFVYAGFGLFGHRLPPAVLAVLAIVLMYALTVILSGPARDEKVDDWLARYQPN